MAKSNLIWMSSTNPAQAAAYGVKDEVTGRYPEGVFVVRSWSEDTLAAKLAVVNRKLAKHGMVEATPISFTRKVYNKVAIETNEEGKAIEVPVAKLPYIESLIYIAAAVIKLEGEQTVIGTIERIGDSDDMVIAPYRSANDDVEAIERLTSVGREIRCDHCHSTRRRNAAYILSNPDGTMSMVAKSCAKLYFGLNVASLLNDLIDLDDEFDSRARASFDRIQHIAVTIGVLKVHGFISQTNAYKINEARKQAGLGTVIDTCSHVEAHISALNTPKFLDGKANPLHPVAVAMAKDNQEEAEDLIVAITDNVPDGGFQANVQALVRSMAYAKDWWKHQGLIVAGIASYLKSEGWELPNVWAFRDAEVTKTQQTAQDLAFAPGYEAAIGTALDFIGVIETIRPYTNNWGGGFILVVRSATNHQIKYFGNVRVAINNVLDYRISDLQVGERVRIQATVSKHDEPYTFRNVTTTATIVSRPAITLISGD